MTKYTATRMSVQNEACRASSLKAGEPVRIASTESSRMASKHWQVWTGHAFHRNLIIHSQYAFKGITGARFQYICCSKQTYGRAHNEGALEIDIEHIIPIFFCGLQEVGALHNACICHHYVQAAILINSPGNQLLHLIPLRHIALRSCSVHPIQLQLLHRPAGQ